MPFTFKKTPLGGVFVINPEYFADDRGFFAETFKQSDFDKNGIPYRFVQDNHSLSQKGVLRGLHFQYAPKAQGKLVRVVNGAVWDVAVDIQPNSPTFKQWYGLEISDENRLMLFIPPGFAHGFVTLRDQTHLLYKCSDEYSQEHDAGIRWDDPDLSIEWPVIEGVREYILSEKDRKLPFLNG